MLALCAGDRYWFENDGVLSSSHPKVDRALRALVWSTTLRTIILRNTRLIPEALDRGREAFNGDLFFGVRTSQRHRHHPLLQLHIAHSVPLVVDVVLLRALRSRIPLTLSSVRPASASLLEY